MINNFLINQMKIAATGKLKLLNIVLIYISGDTLSNRILLVKLEYVFALALSILAGFMVSLLIRIWKWTFPCSDMVSSGD